jgi:hypothetical protein
VQLHQLIFHQVIILIKWWLQFAFKAAQLTPLLTQKMYGTVENITWLEI